MKLLLDTHLLLWAVEESPRLSPEAAELLVDPENELVFSAASIWEIAIKNGKRIDSFQADPGLVREALLENGYTELAVTGKHAVALASLPAIHRDPFDRILIVQSLVEGITLLSADAVLAQYPGLIRLVR